MARRMAGICSRSSGKLRWQCESVNTQWGFFQALLESARLAWLTSASSSKPLL